MCSRPPEIEAVYILKILGQVSLGVWSKQHWQDMTGGNGRLLGWVATGQHWPALATCSSLLVAEIQDMSKSLPEGLFNPGQALANRPQLKRSSWFLRGFLEGFMVNSWKNSSGLKSFPNQKNGRRYHLPRIVLPSAARLATASPLYGTLAHAVQHTPEYETQLPCLFLHRLGSGCCYSPIHLQQVAIMQIISYGDAPP